jgi:hypothetical protein
MAYAFYKQLTNRLLTEKVIKNAEKQKTAKIVLMFFFVAAENTTDGFWMRF